MATSNVSASVQRIGGGRVASCKSCGARVSIMIKAVRGAPAYPDDFRDCADCAEALADALLAAVREARSN